MNAWNRIFENIYQCWNLPKYFKGFDFDFLLIDEFSSTFVYQEQTMIKASIHYTK